LTLFYPLVKNEHSFTFFKISFSYRMKGEGGHGKGTKGEMLKLL